MCERDRAIDSVGAWAEQDTDAPSGSLLVVEAP
jgi:hypothetical protein